MYVIRRGGFSGRIGYFAGFKFDDFTPRARPRAKWSKDAADAIQFGRDTDAKEIIAGLRLYRLSPTAIKSPG